MGLELSLAIGCFREAQLQGLLFGDEPWKAAGMSRPIAAPQILGLPVRKPPFVALRPPYYHAPHKTCEFVPLSIAAPAPLPV